MEPSTEEPVVNCIAENRLGKFSLSRDLLLTTTDDNLRRIFAHFVILRAESMFISDSIEYTAFSPLFQVKHPACEPMVYNLLFHSDSDGMIKVVRAEVW